MICGRRAMPAAGIFIVFSGRHQKGAVFYCADVLGEGGRFVSDHGTGCGSTDWIFDVNQGENCYH
jgi:hypothetical protein